MKKTLLLVLFSLIAVAISAPVALADQAANAAAAAGGNKDRKSVV